MKLNYIITLLCFVIFSNYLIAQDNLPRLSPKSYIGQTVGYTNVEISYGSPGVKNRKIWNDLVPFNEVWRTGANEATTIEFDNDIQINGVVIPAGKYSLFTIPTNKSWTVIFNKVYEQWGAYKYDKNEDLIRFSVTPEVSEFEERLQFSFQYISPYKTAVVFKWEKLKFSFVINTELKKKKD